MTDTAGQPADDSIERDPSFAARHAWTIFAAAILILILTGLAALGIRGARRAARRNSATCQMMQFGLAMHNYLDEHKSFPPQAITDKSGRPLLSWRVALLPYMEATALYEEFHLDEPWDSPHNIKLVSRMPSYYQSLAGERGTKTNYLLPVGKGALYTGTGAVSLKQLPDGTSKTFLIVEADNDQAVTWSEPKDLAYNPANPTRGLGKLWGGNFHVSLADGSVRVLSTNTDPRELRAGFDPADGRGPNVDGF